MVPMWGGTDVKTGNSLWVNIVMAWLSYYVTPKGDEYIKSIFEQTDKNCLSSTHKIKPKSFTIAYCKNVPATAQAHTLYRHLATHVHILEPSKKKAKVSTRTHKYLPEGKYSENQKVPTSTYQRACAPRRKSPHPGEHMKMSKHGRDWVMNRCLVAHTTGYYHHTISRFAILYESNVMQQF